MAKKKKKDSKKSDEGFFLESLVDTRRLIDMLEKTSGKIAVPRPKLQFTDSEGKIAIKTHDEIEEDQIPETTPDGQPIGVVTEPSFLAKEESGEGTSVVEDNTSPQHTENVTEAPAEVQTSDSIGETVQPSTGGDGTGITSVAPEDSEKNQHLPEETAPRDKYAPTGTLFGDVGVFVTELMDSYSERYAMWEDSMSMILKILRKINEINEYNFRLMVSTIEKMHDRIKEGLRKFEIKRKAMEEYAETDFGEVTEMLRKTLTLLALQLKEFKVKNLINKLVEIYS